MNEPTRPPLPPQLEEQLQAFHDGELTGWERRRFERRLRRSPRLQRALNELEHLSDWVQQGFEQTPAPEVWDAIAMRLPAIDARRASQATPRRARGLGWLALPGAVAASAVLALATALGWFDEEAPAPARVVRWLDSGGRDVMVLEGAPDTTIIWVIDGTGPGARRGDTNDAV